MFKPISEMPQAALQDHIRYPQDMFDAQTVQFGKYHVTDPGAFYQGVQLWQVPHSSANSNGPEQLPIESFYVADARAGQANRRLHAAPADGPQRPATT